MSNRWKLILFILAVLAAWYFGWAWLMVFPPLIVLYGLMGSRWEQVDYIPQDGDRGASVYYATGSDTYLNKDGETYKLVERAPDNWASRDNWNKRDDK